MIAEHIRPSPRSVRDTLNVMGHGYSSRDALDRRRASPCRDGRCLVQVENLPGAGHHYSAWRIVSYEIGEAPR
ncbi:MAG: hypothetical protein JWO42_3802 [Chloroflexi bacterium]|nr:hypothetical protein [Chloroflexota bacterium]